MIAYAIVYVVAVCWFSAGVDDGRGRPQKHQPLVDEIPTSDAKGQP